MMVLFYTAAVIIGVGWGFIILMYVCHLIYRVHGLIFNNAATKSAIAEDGFWTL